LKFFVNLTTTTFLLNVLSCYLFVYLFKNAFLTFFILGVRPNGVYIYAYRLMCKAALKPKVCNRWRYFRITRL